jgi:hypothetical protein
MNQHIPGNHLTKIEILKKTCFVSAKIKVMAIYHKTYNLVNTFYQNFTILLFLPVKVFHLTPKRLENCR